MLCAIGYEDVDERWFSPAYWGDKAVPVSAGGRGSAWFIRSARGQLVLRYYRRGGLVARLSERRYLFTGYERTRSFLEFRLLNELTNKGLPVPQPVAALVVRQSKVSYEAAIIIERIEGAQPLPEHSAMNDEALWRRVGQTIAWFHREGLDHVDLNCDNILVSGDRVFLIDFDRCRLRRETLGSANWKESNLKRLRRSVDKRFGQLEPCRIDFLWQVLLAGYQGVTACGNTSSKCDMKS
ncbi:3-deoxy-D-manno-octulosonic acid kinase [Marinobacter lipolyticus]|nr:3-deoxy-D-manno-octulosonic acid kinase [Marinobacter lipolyticus]